MLLHGTKERPAYRPESFFATYELPNIPVGAVPVNVMVVRNASAGEVCGKGSLRSLEDRLVKRWAMIVTALAACA
jgi:hypothetical protein